MDFRNTSPEGLWIYFKVYGCHEAAVEICDRANDGCQVATPYAERIWRREF